MLDKGFRMGLEREDVSVFYDHFVQIQQIWLACKPRPVDDLFISPSCHTVAFAYEEAFGVEAVHGRKMFLTKVRWFRLFDTYKAAFSNYAHSWNVLTLPSGAKVILDLFPNETCALGPIVVPVDSPVYQSNISKINSLCEERRRLDVDDGSVAFFANQFREIARNYEGNLNDQA